MKRGDYGENPIAQPSPQEAGGHDASGVATVGPQGPSGSRGSQGHQTGENNPRSPSDGGPLPSPQAPRDHLRGRHTERIRPEDLDTLENEITQAFQQAQPAIAWNLTRELLELSRKSLVEAAKARFRVNFGTDMCERCDGLRAGKGVVATCYQVKLCYFDNLKEKPTTRQQSIIKDLTRSLPTAPRSPKNRDPEKT